MTYSIGEVAEMLDLTVYTLRYYDKEGLMPMVGRSASGTRVFRESDVAALRVIECLKATGMPIRDIRHFIDWCAQGDCTLQQRYDMFVERKKIVEEQMEALKKTLSVIDFKCRYYKKALEAGTEAIYKDGKNCMIFD
ncbi:MAG: MerR family transcriptional regulator [Spirochaetia bacterium]|jgi:DNA-binding transcriptional MerR regulator|nr:MerR family transcriptional regulator [Spirochaetia bacterium]